MPFLERSAFSSEKFLNDLEYVCKVFQAPYSEEMTRKILDVYATSFHRGATQLRITDRPGDAINYRFYEREPIDIIKPAISAKLLNPQNPMIKLFESWSRLYEGTPIQLCDFDAEKGLAKAWIYLAGTRPLDDILDAPGVPATIIRHRETFHSLQLSLLRYVAVDFHSHSVNLYFRAPGPLTLDQAAQYAALAGSPAPSSSQFTEMIKFLNPSNFTFAVTIDSLTGSIKRVAFYAGKLPAGKFPTTGQRISTFVEEVPSYDQEELNIIAWSFGNGGSTYMKAERSYCGELAQVLTSWRSDMTS
jgi:4-hydroxyphenylpyruvate 3-dimethylallyltransferase